MWREIFCYISPGDLLIARSEQIASSLCFPLKHYHGIAVCIDTEKTPECLSCFLSDVAVQPKRIEEKFCGEKAYFVARSNLWFRTISSSNKSSVQDTRSEDREVRADGTYKKIFCKYGQAGGQTW